MYFKIDITEKSLATALLVLFSQVVIINGQDDYFFITQPPTELQCNPHSAVSPGSSFIRLECNTGSASRSALSAGTRIVWFRRALNSDVEEQLCESDVATLMAASPFTSGQTLLLRSIVELRASELGDLTGEYWCQIAKTPKEDRILLSNRSTILSIRNGNYYREKNLAQCVAGSIFLEIGLSIQTVQFSSSSFPVKFCPPNSNSTTTIILANPTDPPQESEVVDSFILSRMWVYILVPVIATILLFAFLLLLVALVTTCIRKRDPKKNHIISTNGLSANIKLCAASNADKKIKSNGHPGNTTAVPNIRNGIPPATPNMSVGKGSSVHTQLSKQFQPKEKTSQQLNEAEDSNSDDEDYYYTDVPSRNNRKATEVVGKLRGACSGSTSTETDSVYNDAGNLGYRSLDPEAMEPNHTYHAMQLNAASDGPQPTYSEPGVHGHRKPILANGHRPRPTPPSKIPPRLRGGKLKDSTHTSFRSSVDGEYVDPNSKDLNPHMYQGLTPNKQEYLALYMTPDSSPH